MRRRLFKYHPVVGYLKMPNRRFRVHFSDGVFRYQTNSSGFRDNHEFNHEKPSGSKRVLAFGDSFTEGACVSDGERFTDLLRDTLDVEMYNFGLSGTGTDQQYLIYREIGSTFERDLVVIGVWVENIRRNPVAARVQANQDGIRMLTAKPYFTIGDDPSVLQLHNQPVPRPIPVDQVDVDSREGIDPGTITRQGLAGRAAELFTRLGPTPKRFVQTVTRRQPLPEYDDPNGEAWILMRKILEKWAAESSTPVLIVPIPVYQYTEQTASSDAMRDRFAELRTIPGVHVHDPLPDFWEYPKRERIEFRYPTDHHFTPTGHRALAKSLEPVVRGLLDDSSMSHSQEGSNR